MKNVADKGVLGEMVKNKNDWSNIIKQAYISDDAPEASESVWYTVQRWLIIYKKIKVDEIYLVPILSCNLNDMSIKRKYEIHALERRNRNYTILRSTYITIDKVPVNVRDILQAVNYKDVFDLERNEIGWEKILEDAFFSMNPRGQNTSPWYPPMQWIRYYNKDEFNEVDYAPGLFIDLENMTIDYYYRLFAIKWVNNTSFVSIGTKICTERVFVDLDSIIKALNNL